MPIPLRRDALDRLPKSVAVPAYRREDLTPGILHFGVGNFHRAHQATYLDDLFNAGGDRSWGIVGTGVRPADAQMRDALAAQDWLTTVVEQEAGSSTARVTSAMIDFIGPGDVEQVLARLADPAIRIVSLTVTEGGYYIDPATQRFDSTHPDIVADAENPDEPRTAFGLIVAGLRRRRVGGTAPFTVMSCDNLPDNGHITRRAVTGLAELSDGEVAGWIGAEVAFPNSMVDRITPATTDRERKLVSEAFGIADCRPVFCESFRQWVIEDRFPSGRPALEEVGVQFVPDVTPYELMKIRILNGGHAVIAYPAALMDIEFVHEAMENDLVWRFLTKVEATEIVPVVPPVPGISASGYFALIQRRFSNPKIGDTVTRLCLDGSNRQPKFILPTVRDRLAAGAGVAGLALVAALWCRYCYGETDSGRTIAPNDPNWGRLTAQARKARADAAAWLDMHDIFGEVAQEPAYVQAFAAALSALWSRGTKETLARYLDGTLA